LVHGQKEDEESTAKVLLRGCGVSPVPEQCKGSVQPRQAMWCL